MHKNNKIYLLNILLFTQPCANRLNRTQTHQIVVFSLFTCHLTNHLHTHDSPVYLLSCFSSGTKQSCAGSWGQSEAWMESSRNRWDSRHEEWVEGLEKKEKRSKRKEAGKGKERQSELCQMDKCQRELHRPPEPSSPSQNAMCKSWSRGPWPAFPPAL